MIYIPKGSMCISCANLYDTGCSKLPFTKMQVIQDVGCYKVVKCSEFTRRLKPITPSEQPDNYTSNTGVIFL